MSLRHGQILYLRNCTTRIWTTFATHKYCYKVIDSFCCRTQPSLAVINVEIAPQKHRGRRTCINLLQRVTLASNYQSNVNLNELWKRIKIYEERIYSFSVFLRIVLISVRSKDSLIVITITSIYFTHFCEIKAILW